MGLAVMILGESGTGKSASMRNFKPSEIGILNVAEKPLPFKAKGFSIGNTDDYATILKTLATTKRRVIVIDDCQYLMANEYMRRSNEKGYQKFTDIGKNFWELVRYVNKIASDKIVYFLGHTERDAEGNQKFKTIGKLLDEKITVEGMFTIVLKTQVADGIYSFATQNSGHDTVKSPMGMFSTIQIDNDLKAVDTAIREYYELTEDKK